MAKNISSTSGTNPRIPPTPSMIPDSTRDLRGPSRRVASPSRPRAEKADSIRLTGNSLKVKVN